MGKQYQQAAAEKRNPQTPGRKLRSSNTFKKHETDRACYSRLDLFLMGRKEFDRIFIDSNGDIKRV